MKLSPSLIRLATTVTLTFYAIMCNGQDSIAIHRNSHIYRRPQWISTAIAGASLVTTGLTAQLTSTDWTPKRLFPEKSNAVDIMQYAPLSFSWIMKLCGAETRSDWNRMATSHATATIAMAGSVYLLKENSASLRPDGSDFRSFPSGHSAWAYMGATMIAHEFSWKSPWYVIGGYSVASAVAMQRLIDFRHRPCDVAAGAGIGILATQLGYCIGDMIFKDRQTDYTCCNTGNNRHLSLKNAYGFTFASHAYNHGQLKLDSYFETSIDLSVPFNESWSISSGVAVRSTSIYADCGKETTFVAPLNSIGINICPCFTPVRSGRYTLSGNIGGGYYRNFSLKSIDRSIDTDNNTFVGRASITGTVSISDNLNIAAGIGYEFYNTGFSFQPNDKHGISTDGHTDKIAHAISIGLSTQAIF